MMIHAARLLAGAFAATGLMSLIAALVAARTGTGPAVFVGTSAVCLFLAGALRFSVGGAPSRPGRAHGISSPLLVWFVVPLASMPAIAAVSGLPPLAAFLEAVSAFTTTGATSLTRGPVSLFVFLALLQWAGGLFTIISALTILAPAGIGGLPDRACGRETTLDAVEIGGVVREMAPIYAAGTLLLILVLLLDGQSFYVAFTLATAATSAGAHLPPEAQIALTVDAAPKWLVLPFPLGGRAAHGGPRPPVWARRAPRGLRGPLIGARRIHAAPEQPESLLLIGWVLMLGVLIAALLVPASDQGTLDVVRDGLFSAASLVATSGIGPPDGTYAALPAGLVLGVVLLGGGMFSAAGGLKMLRLRAIVLRIRGDLTRLVSPNLVQPAALAEGGVGSAMRGVWIGTAMLFVVYGLCVIALSPGLPNFAAALTAAAAVVANCGPVYDAAGQGWPALGTLPAGSVIAAALGMVAGRLEIIGMFVVVHLAMWRI